MAGWNLKKGIIKTEVLTEDQIWALFNFVFSDASKKRNTYKYGLIKSLLDNLFNGKITKKGIFYSYDEIFGRFAENYWNLVVKYHLKQMRRDGKSQYSKIETIFYSVIKNNYIYIKLDFSCLSDLEKKNIIKNVTNVCKKYVIGALYEDFDGIIYSFDLNEQGLYLNYWVYEFMMKYKLELEKLNYYSWAKFLEQINDDNVLTKTLDKLELATPERSDTSIYRRILYNEFEQNVCFYCGRKLKDKIHVDHFIPWSFIRNDKIWNFVLACPKCNLNKSDKLAEKGYLNKIIKRNEKVRLLPNKIIQSDFENYDEKLLVNIWIYAKMGGMKIYK